MWPLARLCLYEAATVIMTRIKRPLDLKVWATKIAKRSGTNKARVALARKLAVILHRSGALANRSAGARARQSPEVVKHIRTATTIR
jgi:hypothetical protein